MPQLFENALYIDTLAPMKNKNQNPNELGYHHFIAPIVIEGNIYRVLITGKEKINSKILYSLNIEILPTKSGTAFVSYSDRTYNATPGLLAEKGYYTFSMHGNNADFWNRRAMHKSLGYDRFYSKEDYNVTEENTVGLGINDYAFFDQSVEKIKKIADKHEKWYGMLMMLSNHTPFSELDKYGDFPVDIKETITNEDGQQEDVTYPYMEGTKLGNYFKSAHYADGAIGELMAKLEEEGLLENTVVIIYGDHDARLPRSDYNRLYNYDK